MQILSIFQFIPWKTQNCADFSFVSTHRFHTFRKWFDSKQRMQQQCHSVRSGCGCAIIGWSIVSFLWACSFICIIKYQYVRHVVVNTLFFINVRLPSQIFDINGVGKNNNSSAAPQTPSSSLKWTLPPLQRRTYCRTVSLSHWMYVINWNLLCDNVTTESHNLCTSCMGNQKAS